MYHNIPYNVQTMSLYTLSNVHTLKKNKQRMIGQCDRCISQYCTSALDPIKTIKRKDPRGPRDPRGQSVAKPIERALF